MSRTVIVDGVAVEAPDEATILDACHLAGADVPTLCYLETLTPANACRLCSVEVDGSRTLAPACSRVVTEGMVVRTDTERVRRARRMVVELLASAVDLETAPELAALVEAYGAEPDRYHEARARVEGGAEVDNDLYVRDLGKCVLCYRCVEACGDDAQHSYAIAIAGRGFEARVATEFDVSLPDSACVFCGNCVGVCPTGALMVRTEFDLRSAGDWHPERQQVVRTVCGYCGVGCNLGVHVQDGRIVKVTSPFDHDVTAGNLCVKGRFGWTHVAG